MLLAPARERCPIDKRILRRRKPFASEDAAMKWPETVIDTPHGRKKAVAPLVISASRATDIPAFHAAWFMNRLRAGCCLWRNPFNAAQQQWISFESCRVFVFWSKNPAPFMPHLPEIAASGREFYFQYTLNDYEGTGLEPHLPPLERRVETFRQLSELVSKKRVIWRFDPIILGGGLTVENTLSRLCRLAEQLSPYTEKLVFSFVDWYRKTAHSLGKLNPDFRPPNDEEKLTLARGLARINGGLSRPLKLASCAEAIDLSSLGVERNRCVDPQLLHRLCPDCETFARWCGKERESTQLSLLDPLPTPRTGEQGKQRGGPRSQERNSVRDKTRGCGSEAFHDGRRSTRRNEDHQGFGSACRLRLCAEQGHRRLQHLPSFLRLLLRRQLRKGR